MAPPVPRVVVCRAAHQAAGVIAALQGLDIEVVSLPLLEIAPPADGGAALRAELRRIDRFDWVVFTSTNAVDAVQRHGGDELRALTGTSPPREIHIAAVGSATAAAARDAGFGVDVVPPAATAVSLVQALIPRRPQNVLAPLAELAADTLEDGLRAAGAAVTRVEAYRMAVPELSAEKIDAAADADVVLLTSPSIAERFAQLIGADRVEAMVIGPSTEHAARALGYRIIGSADPHTTEGLVDLLAQWRRNTIKG